MVRVTASGGPWCGYFGAPRPWRLGGQSQTERKRRRRHAARGVRASSRSWPACPGVVMWWSIAIIAVLSLPCQFGGSMSTASTARASARATSGSSVDLISTYRKKVQSVRRFLGFIETKIIWWRGPMARRRWLGRGGFNQSEGVWLRPRKDLPTSDIGR
jgi:hypothetical protein